jgi:hypothetical protein
MVALREHGLSFHSIAEALNLTGVPSPRGGAWWVGGVYRILKAYRPGLCPPPSARPLVDAEEHHAALRQRDAARYRERYAAKKDAPPSS